MNPPIESMTTAALSAALDVAQRRQAAVAANIANAGSEGYTPLRLSFQTQLDEARASLRERGWLDRGALEALRNLPQPAAEEGAGPVQLDVEMTELASNALQFQALVQGMSRHLGLLAMAAGDGRK
jgi:flagellar basal-body rod protein FlgB